MEPFSFKKLRFFRSEESRTKKTMNNAQVVGKNQKKDPVRRLLEHPHVFLVIFALAIAYLTS